MADLLLDIPFNETPGSGVATDYSGSDAPARIVGGDFVEGRAGRAYATVPNAYAIVDKPVVPLNGTYTLSVWVRAEATEKGPNHTWLLVRFPPDPEGSNRILYVDVGAPLTFWTYFVLWQETTRISVALNGRLASVAGFPSGWGKPTGWAIVNDTPTCRFQWEELKVYAGVLDDDLFIPTNPELMTVNYFINNVAFADFGVRVADSNGLFDNLPLKESLTQDWEGYHGKVIDLSKPRYDVRDISLSCFCYATSAADWIDKLRSFLSAFRKAGTQRLMLQVSGRVFVFEVYLPESINLKKKWSDNGMVGTFELKLVEPEPVKRVLKYTGTGTVSITLTSSKVVNIYWGDETSTKDVYGTGKALTHTYTTPGDKYIIVAGVIEDITAFSSNAQTVYSLI